MVFYNRRIQLVQLKSYSFKQLLLTQGRKLSVCIILCLNRSYKLVLGVHIARGPYVLCEKQGTVVAL